MACPHFRSPEWIALENKIGIFEAFREYLKNGEEVPDASKYEETFKGVNATLRVVDALAAPKMEQFFKNQYLKGNKDKFFSELKPISTQQQIDALKKIDEEFPAESLNDMIMNVLTQMSYTVEIKTAQGKGIIDEEDMVEQMMENGQRRGFDSTPKSKNTSYYQYLTVPGGTNYKENEIRTPAIVPSITGHAQFATKNGIGWFRVDEKDITVPIIVKQQGEKAVQEYRNAKIGLKDNSNKTLRILEIQSDLFQKGRFKEDLINSDRSYEIKRNSDGNYDVAMYIEEGNVLIDNAINTFSDKDEAQNYIEELSRKENMGNSKNNFLQILNKENNWISFFVRSIVQDSQKKGYEHILFPSGDTAARVEGHDTLTTFVAQRERWIKNLDKRISNPKIYEEEYNKSLEGIEGRLNYLKREPMGKEELEEEQKYYDRYKREKDKEIQNLLEQDTETKEEFQLEIEQAQSGTMKLSSIANFYEKTIQSILSKRGYDPKEITDEFGNKWFQINLKEVNEDLVSFDIQHFPRSYEGQRDQFVERWKLKGVVKSGEFGYVAKSGIATRALADRMKEQLATKSGDLYNNVRIRYDATYGLIKIDPVIKEDLISENQDEVSFSLDNSGQRSYVELPKDFSKIPTTELKANVLSVNPIKTDTYVRGGEYFNVERIRYGTASDLTSFMRVNRDQIEPLFKYSRLTPQSIKDFVKDKSEIKFYAYRVTRVEDPEEFINPDEDSAISKFRIAKVTQRNNLRKRRNSVTDETERREIYKEINRITAQIKEISKPKNQNIAFLKAKYEEDKELYANTIPKNIGELKYIDNLFQGYKILFHSTDTTIFGEEVDNDFKQAIKDIDAYQKKLKDNFNKVAIKSMEFKGKLTLTNSDGELLPVSDISFLQSFLLSTSDTTNNPLVRYITNLSYTAISKARDKATREGDIIKKAVNELVKWGKTKGLSGAALYDFMLEEDGEGKPTGYFAIHYGKFFSQLQKTIKNPKSDKDMVNTYLEFLSKNANNIEIETDKFKAEFQKIYEQKRAQLSLTEEDPRAIEEEALAETTRITYGINPENFIKILSKYKLSTPLADSEIKFVKTYIDRGGANRFMKVIPKEEFVDPKYAKMMELPENHPQRVFYKLFVEAHYAIGNRMRNDDGSTLRRNFIAEYKRDYKGDDESMIDYLKRDIWDSAVALTTESPRDNIQGVDAITGEILRFIPFYAFDGRIAPEDKNYNLGKVMMNLTKEFAQYELLSEIEDPLKTAEHILKETKTYATNGIGDRIYIDKEPVFNPDTSNVSKQLDYKILATLYGQRMKKEGVGAKKVYDYKTSQRMKALRELKKNNGEFTLEEEKEYRDLLKKYTVPTVKKSANLLMNATSILNIGFNLFSGAAELIQANLSVFLRYGAKAWYEDVFTTAINLHTPFDPVAKNKLKGLRKMFNVDGDINAEMKESKFKKVAFATFGPARSIGNTAYLVAVLKDHNIKNKAGEEFRLFDVINFDETGKIVLPEGFDNIFYESDGVTYSQYKYNLGQIVSKEIRDNRDREDALDPIASDQIALGRLVGQFKKSWLFQGFNTRVGGLKEGMNDLDSKSKGIYRSMYDISKGYTEYLDEFGEVQQVFSPLKTLGNIAVNLVKYSPIARTLGFGKDNGTHDQLDYEGAVRTARELQTALALYALYIAIAAARANAGPDDPVVKMASTALLNSVMRYQRDASTYFDPNSLASIINKNVIPSLSTITDAYKLLMDPVHGVVSDKWYYNEGQSNEQLRISRDAQDMLPLLNQIRRHMNKLTNNQSIFYNTSY